MQSENNTGIDDLRVVDLMVPRQRRWNLEALSVIFSAEEAALIQQIPLSFRNHEDVWMWHFETKVFTQSNHVINFSIISCNMNKVLRLKYGSLFGV